MHINLKVREEVSSMSEEQSGPLQYGRFWHRIKENAVTMRTQWEGHPGAPQQVQQNADICFISVVGTCMSVL